MISIWENQSFLHNNDVLIVGGGVVGLSCGLSILERFPSKRVTILERAQLPCGASTKNAGILSVGGLESFMSDVKEKGKEEAVKIFALKQESINILLRRLQVEQVEYTQDGHFRLFGEEFVQKYPEIEEMVKEANQILFEHFQKDVFVVRNDLIEEYGFNQESIKCIIQDTLSGQINTGKTIRALIQRFNREGGLYLTGCEVIKYEQIGQNNVNVEVKNTLNGYENHTFYTENLLICTNGFTNNILKEKLDLQPNRGQMISTKPLKGLKIKGSFSMDDDYIYFRNFHDQIIIGGGRNIDFKGEQTQIINNTEVVCNQILKVLKEEILVGVEFEVELCWSGIMCFSKDNESGFLFPLLGKESENVFYAARFVGNGMSLAGGSGEQMSKIIFGESY